MEEPKLVNGGMHGCHFLHSCCQWLLEHLQSCSYPAIMKNMEGKPSRNCHVLCFLLGQWFNNMGEWVFDSPHALIQVSHKDTGVLPYQILSISMNVCCW